MEYLTITDWPGGTVPVFEEELPKELARRDGGPGGLLARYAGEYGGGLRIVAVWTSQEDAEGFFATMPEAVAKRLAPASGGVPSVAALASVNTYVAAG